MFRIVWVLVFIAGAMTGLAIANEDEQQDCGNGQQCTATEFCAYTEADRCGREDQDGTCQPRPEFCTKIYQPVCGCDGNTYGNACEAHAAGVNIEQEGEC